MFTYLSIMILFIFFSIKNFDSKKITFLCGTILFFFMGFKGSYIGNDTRNYIYFFERLGTYTEWYNSLLRFEIGFQIYNRFIYLYFQKYQYLFIFTALVCMFCISKVIRKNSVNVGYSFFLFVGLRFYYFFLSGLRQAIAISIVFLSFNSLKDKKYIKFLFLIFLASTFHITAIISLLALPLTKYKFTKRKLILIFLFIIIMYLFFNNIIFIILKILPTYYSHYVTTIAFKSGNLGNYINFIIKLIFIIIIYIFNYYKNNEKKIKNLYIYFMIIATGISLFATKASILDRLEQYFWIFSILVIPDIINSCKVKRNRIILGVSITIFVLIYNLSLLYLRPEWNLIIPYYFFWEEL